MQAMCNRCGETATRMVDGLLLSNSPEFLCEHCYEDKKLNTCDRCGYENDHLALVDDKAFCGECLAEIKDELIIQFAGTCEGIIKILEQIASDARGARKGAEAQAFLQRITPELRPFYVIGALDSLLEVISATSLTVIKQLKDLAAQAGRYIACP